MDEKLLAKDKELERIRTEAERRQKRADDTHNDDQERIHTLERESAVKDTRIADLEQTIVQKDEELEKKEEVCSTWQRLYNAAIEVGEYICKIFRIHFDFEKCVDMREDGYRLNYIFDNEDRAR